MATFVSLAQFEADLAARWDSVAPAMELSKEGWPRKEFRFHGVSVVNGVRRDVIQDVAVYDYGTANENTIDLDRNKEIKESDTLTQLMTWFEANKSSDILVYRPLSIDTDSLTSSPNATLQVWVLENNTVTIKKVFVYKKGTDAPLWYILNN